MKLCDYIDYVTNFIPKKFNFDAVTYINRKHRMMKHIMKITELRDINEKCAKS